MSRHRGRQIRMVWVPHHNMPSAFDDCKALRAVQTPKVILPSAKGHLSHACEEIVCSRHRASVAQSRKQILYMAAISAWGYGISRRGSMSM